MSSTRSAAARGAAFRGCLTVTGAFVDRLGSSAATRFGAGRFVTVRVAAGRFGGDGLDAARFVAGRFAPTRPRPALRAARACLAPPSREGRFFATAEVGFRRFPDGAGMSTSCRACGLNQ
jgi:hypothetical protein